MTRFDNKYFRSFDFTTEQVRQYLDNALRDATIAKEDPHPEVRFTYSYNALLKACRALLAARGGVKVRSVPGHHVKTIEKAAEILEDDSLIAMGNAMRMKRNEDLYGGGVYVTEKESREYVKFAEDILKKVREKISGEL